MKGDKRRDKRKQQHKRDKFQKRKQAVEKLQRDIKKFLGKSLNDKLIFHFGDKKAYSKIDQIRQKYSKGIKGKPYPV